MTGSNEADRYAPTGDALPTNVLYVPPEFAGVYEIHMPLEIKERKGKIESIVFWLPDNHPKVWRVTKFGGKLALWTCQVVAALK